MDVREDGRDRFYRFYRLNAEALKPIHDWVGRYERLWSARFDRLDAVIADLKRQEHHDERTENRP
ncbi:hypothetical protein [Streptomyces bluensis]|uniref:Transcriptional regulator n=1 Tax=Streptomyces bluensis TaxID=33897 RepID=A0ABW6ULW9_9ACTN